MSDEGLRIKFGIDCGPMFDIELSEETVSEVALLIVILGIAAAVAVIWIFA